jgi:hypothetical protein
MTDTQLQKLLDSIPVILLAIGTLYTTIVTLRTKGMVKNLQVQGDEIRAMGADLGSKADRIETQTNGAFSRLEEKFDSAMREVTTLREHNAEMKQEAAVKAAETPIQIIGPKGDTGLTGPKGEPGPNNAETLPPDIQSLLKQSESFSNTIREAALIELILKERQKGKKS